MSAMRPERPPWPAAGFERLHDVQVSGQPIAVDRIEQQDVTVAPQAGVPVEEPGLRRREQRLSRRDRAGVAGGDGADGVEIERVADILEPPEPKRRERRSRVETARCRIGVDRIYG